VKSELSPDFLTAFRRLPPRIQEQARKNYRLWKSNPRHPSLEFKRVGKKSPVYSVRVAIGWRALGLLEENLITWFWIGSHATYDRLLKKL
jgi:hypothetical protein